MIFGLESVSSGNRILDALSIGDYELYNFISLVLQLRTCSLVFVESTYIAHFGTQYRRRRIRDINFILRQYIDEFTSRVYSRRARSIKSDSRSLHNHSYYLATFVYQALR